MKKRLMCACVVIAILASCVPAFGATVSPKTLSLEKTQILALSNSSEISELNNQLILKRMKYTESVANIKAKMKNKRSFRYTPLLSLKFPEQLDLVEEFDLNIKPIVLQTEITMLRHKLESIQYDVINNANLAFYKVYVFNEKLIMTQSKLDASQQQLILNTARLASGDATQTDVDNMQKRQDALTAELSQTMRNFETSKQELSDLIKLDISVGYTFANPFKTADIPRAELTNMQQHTLDKDQAHFETKMAYSVARLNLDAYESYMRKQYGGKLNFISPYISAVKAGSDVDYSAFQISYKQMLEQLDKPWDGSIKILFFKLSKEWFKGEISGTRYIEDEMYAIYTACMEYAAAKRELTASEKSINKEVASAFENLVSSYNAYKQMKAQLATANADLKKLESLNKTGKASFSELSDKQEECESLEIDLLDTLASYNELLSSADMLTCGYISQYLNGEGTVSAITTIGTSNKPWPMYQIYTAVEDMVFVFGIEMPEDFDIDITHYELWCEGIQIGSRTAISQQLRHLAIDYANEGYVTVRLYNEGEYVGEAVADTTVPKDKLIIQGIKESKAEESAEVCGVYTVKTTQRDAAGFTELTIIPNEKYQAAYYVAKYKASSAIISNELTDIKKSFTYLSLMVKSLEDIEIELYSADKKLVKTVILNTENLTLTAKA